MQKHYHIKIMRRFLTDKELDWFHTEYKKHTAKQIVHEVDAGRFRTRVPVEELVTENNKRAGKSYAARRSAKAHSVPV